MQLSLLADLEATRFVPQPKLESASFAGAEKGAHLSPMAAANRPTQAQVSYLKKLTRIKTDTQLARYVLRKLSKDGQASSPQIGKTILTKADFAKVIDLEVAEKRWTL